MPDGPILIVDDNPANMKLASFVLTSKGYTVRTASNAKEALIEIASFPPRLVLMDIQLPDIDGLELTRRLKAEPATRAIIVVAVTAYAMAGDEDKARRAGCDGYITKPIDTRTLATLWIFISIRPAKRLGNNCRTAARAVSSMKRSGASGIMFDHRARRQALPRRRISCWHCALPGTSPDRPHVSALQPNARRSGTMQFPR